MDGRKIWSWFLMVPEMKIHGAGEDQQQFT
jgi:hypothetical protein